MKRLVSGVAVRCAFHSMEKIIIIISFTSSQFEEQFGEKLRYFLPSLPFGVSTCCVGNIAPGGAGSIAFILCFRSIANCAIDAPECASYCVCDGRDVLIPFNYRRNIQNSKKLKAEIFSPEKSASCRTLCSTEGNFLSLWDFGHTC